MNNFVEIMNDIINRKMKSKDMLKTIKLKTCEINNCYFAVKREIEKERTLEQIIYDWDKGCCNKEYLSSFKIFIIEVWDKITGDDTPVWEWLDV